MSGLQLEVAGLLTARTALALFFLPAAIIKFKDHRGFEEGVRDYAILPDRAVRPVAIGLLLVESTLGLALLVGIAPPLMGALAALLLMSFITAVGINLHRGRRIDCGCYGVATTKHIGVASIVRNIALLGLSIAVVSTGAIATEPGQWLNPWVGWAQLTSGAHVLLIMLMTMTCIVSVYLLEWSLDTESQARSATARLREASS